MSSNDARVCKGGPFLVWEKFLLQDSVFVLARKICLCLCVLKGMTARLDELFLRLRLQAVWQPFPQPGER